MRALAQPSRAFHSRSTGDATIQGIALGEAGEPIGYWLHRVHPGAAWSLPGAAWLGSERIPAADVLHIYRKRRPGQLRDVSWLAPVLLRLRDLGDYEAALLMKAKIEACLAAVVNGSPRLMSAASTITSATTVNIIFASLLDYAELTAEITAGRGQIAAAQALAVQVTGGTLAAAGSAARNASSAGNPLHLATGVSANPTAVTSGRNVDLLATLIGALVTKPNAILEADWQYAAAAQVLYAGGVLRFAPDGTGVQAVSIIKTLSGAPTLLLADIVVIA